MYLIFLFSYSLTLLLSILYGFSMAKVLLTGSTGFVGSHIAETLIDSGHQVICLIRATSNLKWLSALKVEYRLCDFGKTDAFSSCLKDVDVIVHSAAVLRAFNKDAYYEINQRITGQLAKSALEHKPDLRKFIYISSQAAMGPSSSFTPKQILEPENPVSDYGKSKLAGEKELQILQNKIPFTIFRPSSVYGPRDKDIFFLFRLAERGLRPKPIKKKYVQMLYVKDLACAVAKAIENNRTDNKTYFIGEENPYSIDEIAKSIGEVINKKTIPLFIPDFALRIVSFFSEKISRFQNQPALLNRQKIDELLQTYWLADSSEIKKDLGMDFTKLKIGAKITYQWYKENNWL